MGNPAFLETLEKHMTSDNYFVRDFVLNIIDKSFLGREETFMAGLRANRKNVAERGTNAHLAYLKNLPKPAEGLALLLHELEENDMTSEQLHFFKEVFNFAGPCVVAAHQNDIEQVFSKKGLKLGNLNFFTDLCTDQKNVVTQKLQAVIDRIEATDYFDGRTYIFGKQIISVIADRGFSGETELLHRLKKMQKKTEVSVRDLYDIALAGEMGLEEAVPYAAFLAQQHGEDDVLLEEITKMLIKTGSDKAVDSAEQLTEKNGPAFHAIEVLTNIKTDYARQALLRVFEKSRDLSLKTMAAAGLCEHLWPEAVLLTEKFIDSEGYDRSLLNLTEHLYCNAVINELEHQKLAEWRENLEEEGRQMNQNAAGSGLESYSGEAAADSEDRVSSDNGSGDVPPEEAVPGGKAAESEPAASHKNKDEGDHGSVASGSLQESGPDRTEPGPDTEEPDKRSGAANDDEIAQTEQKETADHIETKSDVSREEIQAAMKRIHEARMSQTKRRKQIKVGRNDLCPCGSGKKYKKCCM